jgi:hypothetical protein
MKLTEGTLKQYIKQVLAEQRRYPMKRSKDPGEQKRQRFEINAACYGWLREPVKPGDLGKPNRVWGDCIEKSLITKEEWRQARRLNWNDDLKGAQRILDGAAGEKGPEVQEQYSENWQKGFRPLKWESDSPAHTRLAIKGCLKARKEGKNPQLDGYATHSIGMKMSAGHTQAKILCSDVLRAKGLLPGTDPPPVSPKLPRRSPEESSRFRRDPIDTTRKRTPWDLLYDLAKDDAKIIAQIARWQEENKKIGNLGLPRGPRKDRYGRRPITGRANSDPGYQFVRDMLQAAGYKVSDEEWDPSKWEHHSTTTLPTFDPETGRSAPIKESVAYSSFPEQQKLHEGWKDYLEPK